MFNTSDVTKQEFVLFLTNDVSDIIYNSIHFTKTIKNKIIRIKANQALVYEVHKEKKLLIVVDALFCTFNRDAYWDVAKLADLEEVLADPKTLVRI
ncbi:MAG: hypothetical protein ACRCSG_04255 [Cellulosilyticaceae bacterium]